MNIERVHTFYNNLKDTGFILFIFSTSDRLLSDVLLLSKVREFVDFSVFLGGRGRPWEAMGGRGRPWEAVVR